MPSVLGGLVEAILPPLTRGVGVALPALHNLTLQGTVLQGSALRAASLGGIASSLPKLSANEIIRQVRGMGLPLRRQSALKAIAAMRTQVDAFTYIINLTPGRVPLRDRIPFASRRQRLAYQYTMRVVGRDKETGEVRAQLLSINHTRLMSKNAAKAYALDNADLGGSAGLKDIMSVDVVLITKQNPYLVNA